MAGGYNRAMTKRAKKGKGGALQKQESRLAMVMLLPTVAVVLSVVAFPLLANFWISVKKVSLGDLRPAAPIVREQLRPAQGGFLTARYRIRNSSKKSPLTDIIVRDTLPQGLTMHNAANAGKAGEDNNGECQSDGADVICKMPVLKAGGAAVIILPLRAAAGADIAALRAAARESRPQTSANAESPITSTELTFANYAALFNADDFWRVIKVSMLYAVFGAGGALFLGLLAALWLSRRFRGRALWRGMLLFPYVAPVIAVAFTWIVLFDPFSGAFNALMVRAGLFAAPVNFFGARSVPVEVFGYVFSFPLALASVIAFECWRYFPLAFLFILARMQSLNDDLDAAADMDGASPLQKFRHVVLPQLAGVLSVMFLLRFIWTFNKFDDIFLLTGGASGTRTLVVNVYEQAFALSNIGAGAAAAVVVFVVLVICCLFYFRIAPKGEGW